MEYNTQYIIFIFFIIKSCSRHKALRFLHANDPGWRKPLHFLICQLGMSHRQPAGLKIQEGHFSQGNHSSPASQVSSSLSAPAALFSPARPAAASRLCCLCWLPWWLRGKEPGCQCRRCRSIPGSGRSPGEGNGNPLQHSCLGNPMHRGAWWATAHRVIKRSNTA